MNAEKLQTALNQDLPTVDHGLERLYQDWENGLRQQLLTFFGIIGGRMELKIGKHWIGGRITPTYFIADIAANHDGDLNRALELIRLAAEAGANAAKFQNFRGPEIVSDYGFSHMNAQVSHQAKWKRALRRSMTRHPFL